MADHSAPAVDPEALVRQGVPAAEANRLAVRASVIDAMETSFHRFGRLYLGLVVLLILGMVCVFLWSDSVYEMHSKDYCDQPFALMLRLLYIAVAVHLFQREIIKICLCYDATRDGAVEPCRVTAFRRATLTATLLWPVITGIMLLESTDCTHELRQVVEVITAYYAVVALVAFVMPACCITIMLYLIRRGLVRPHCRRNAAPDELIEQLPTVEYEPSRFDDERAPETYPQQCPVCLEAFDGDTVIKRTPCRPNAHVFHKECLQGWLNVARTCPLCRTDLTLGGEEAASLADSAGASV